jgi:hypothetical protein
MLHLLWSWSDRLVMDVRWSRRRPCTIRSGTATEEAILALASRFVEPLVYLGLVLINYLRRLPSFVIRAGAAILYWVNELEVSW